MLEFWQTLILTAVFVALTIILIGFTIIPWCKQRKIREDRESTWGRMAYNHDTYTIASPVMPPYFFVNELSYDGYIAPF